MVALWHIPADGQLWQLQPQELLPCFLSERILITANITAPTTKTKTNIVPQFSDKNLSMCDTSFV